jgi:hypothetical protein
MHDKLKLTISSRAAIASRHLSHRMVRLGSVVICNTLRIFRSSSIPDSSLSNHRISAIQSRNISSSVTSLWEETS